MSDQSGSPHWTAALRWLVESAPSSCREKVIVSLLLDPVRRILTVAVPMLTAIKLLHTVVWAILAGSIVVLPFAGVFAPIPLGCDPDRARAA
jgi:hypothetical protein